MMHNTRCSTLRVVIYPARKFRIGMAAFGAGALCMGAVAAIAATPVPAPRPALRQTVQEPAQKTAPPVQRGAPRHRGGLVPDSLEGAVPVNKLDQLPSTEQQYQGLKNKIDQVRPVVTDAKEKSETLKAEAAALQDRLVKTAARVQFLEAEKITLDARIITLSKTEKSLARDFARDKVKVAKLLAILQRLQHDMPPVIALRADDALGAAHGAMLLGASLPRVYGAAAALSRNLRTLRTTRAELVQRRADGVRNAAQLKHARKDLDQLLAMKQREAQSASAQYGTLQSELDAISAHAADLQSLLDKVARLRRGGSHEMVTVVSENGAKNGKLARGALLRPVVGRLQEGGFDGVGGERAPGISFTTAGAAQVVAPTDSTVLFAGPYHKSGEVLILKMAAGYDLVLAGLGRVTVKPADRLLAGEPVGVMPQTGQTSRLYFELRRDGKGLSPVPWLKADIRKADKT